MRRRILLAILLAVTVTGCALGVPLGFSALTVVESLARGDLVQGAQKIATTLDDEIARGAKIDLSKVRLALPQNGRVVVNTPRTGRLVYGPDPGEQPVTEQAPLLGGGTVELAQPSDPLRDQQWKIAAFVLLLVVISLGTGAVVAIMTARRLAEPLRHLSARAARLGAGDFRDDATRYGVDELDRVAETLDTSGRDLARLLQRERDLVGDVSHQLRSRLTALQLRIEGLTESHDADTVVEAGAAMEQAEQLAKVLDDLLAASRAARAKGAEPVDLAKLFAVIAQEWRSLLRGQGRQLRIRVPEGTLAVATAARLREAIGVLLDNAVRHGAGEVTLVASREQSAVVVRVSDKGEGVPDELVAHIFDRGVSGGGSTGVGLALARALVDADGGRLELSTARPATFTIFLLVPSTQRHQPWQPAGPR